MGTIKESNERLEDINEFIYNNGIASKIQSETGSMAGKYDVNVSLSSHLLNVLSLGLNSYVYDTIHIRNESIDEESIAVLTSSLVLHDLNKYLSNKNNEKYNNTEKSLDIYLKEDKFNLQSLFKVNNLNEDINNYKYDILYLIQRTEQSQNGINSSNKVKSKFKSLVQYCQFADSTVSSITVDGFNKGVQKIKSRYPDNTHVVNLNSIEYPLLNTIFMNSVKQYIKEQKEGLILGSSKDKIVYLCEKEINLEKNKEIIDIIEKTVTDNFNFKSKVKWNTYEYQTLKTVPISIDEKRQIISDNWANVLERDSGRENGLENISTDARKIIPEFAKIIFEPSDARHKIEEDTKKIYIDNDLEEIYEEADEKSSSHSMKIYLLHLTIKHFEENYHNIMSIVKEYEDSVDKDLTVNENIFKKLYPRFLGNKLQNVEVCSSENVCFLCGKHSNIKYKPGDNGVFSTKGFSRRTKPYQSDKNICSMCQFETSLLDSFIDVSPNAYAGSFEGDIIYLQNQEFIFDASINFDWKNKTIGGKIIDIYDEDNWELEKYGIINNFELIPIVYNGEGNKLRVLHKLLKFIQSTGTKAYLSRAFSNFESHSEVFIDTDPNKIELSLGIDKIDTYEELDKYIKLLDIMDDLDIKKDRRYTRIKEDDFVTIIDIFIRDSNISIQRKDLNDITSYIKMYHSEEYMKMKEISELGIELYGKSFGSKHSQTSVFREALNSILESMSMNLDDEDVVDYVSGQVYALSERQQYSGNVKTEQADNYVQSIIDYLTKNDMYSKQKLSDNKNRLINAYHFCYRKSIED